MACVRLTRFPPTIVPSCNLCLQDICLAQGRNCAFSHMPNRNLELTSLTSCRHAAAAAQGRLKILLCALAAEASTGAGEVRTSACVKTVRGSDRWATVIWGHELQLGNLCRSLPLCFSWGTRGAGEDWQLTSHCGIHELKVKGALIPNNKQARCTQPLVASSLRNHSGTSLMAACRELTEPQDVSFFGWVGHYQRKVQRRSARTGCTWIGPNYF